MFVIATPAPAPTGSLSGYFIGADALAILGHAYRGDTHVGNCATYATRDEAEADIARAARLGFVIPAGYAIRPATAREQVRFRLTRLAVANMRGDWSAARDWALHRRLQRVAGRVAVS